MRDPIQTETRKGNRSASPCGALGCRGTDLCKAGARPRTRRGRPLGSSGGPCLVHPGSRVESVSPEELMCFPECFGEATSAFRRSEPCCFGRPSRRVGSVCARGPRACSRARAPQSHVCRVHFAGRGNISEPGLRCRGVGVGFRARGREARRGSGRGRRWLHREWPRRRRWLCSSGGLWRKRVWASASCAGPCGRAARVPGPRVGAACVCLLARQWEAWSCPPGRGAGPGTPPCVGAGLRRPCVGWCR